MEAMEGQALVDTLRLPYTPDSVRQLTSGESNRKSGKFYQRSFLAFHRIHIASKDKKVWGSSEFPVVDGVYRKEVSCGMTASCYASSNSFYY
jgi:hypothetical protein